MLTQLVLCKVEELVTDDARAKEIDAKGAKSAPAVVFTDQNQKKVAHKPGTLSDLDKE
jgi:Hypervirulence associated proteins TUDOR domain